MSVKNSISELYCRGIYFLWYGKEIVYIGISKCILTRISQHKKNKCFDRFTFKEYDVSDMMLKSIERKLIMRHKPKYNKVHKKYKKRSVRICINR